MVDNIQKYHPLGFKGIIKILLARKNSYSKYLVVSLILVTTLFFLWFNYSSLSSYEVLVSLNSRILDIFPNILGFSLGGYALIIGFGNSELLSEIAKKDKFSTFQLLSAFFATVLLLQVILILLAFLISTFLDLQITIICNDFISNVINLSFAFTMLIIGSFTFIMSPWVIINLFTLGQLHNVHVTIQKFKNKT